MTPEARGFSPAEFIAKWSRADLPERAASQEHFLDLCRLLKQPTPAEHDSSGAEYTFEKAAAVTGPASRGSKGAGGYVDAWWKNKFAWEYKRKGRYATLDDAYRQLLQYREALGNPPLLIVSDIARIQIHTNFTGTSKVVHEIALEAIGEPDNLNKLRRVFTNPDWFKPGIETWKLTEQAAAEFAKISDQLRQRGHDPHDAAHFLMKCMFCLFAEDVKLLPEQVFTKLLERSKSEPEKLTERLNKLFAAMRAGGDFGTELIAHFNGGLFDDALALPLRAYDINALLLAAQHDWGFVEPVIFGTLFERSLDPSKRAQIGAHYTSREDILLIVEPVVVAPLRREWEDVQAACEKLVAKRQAAAGTAAKKKVNAQIADALDGFVHRLATMRILDPACGSGNFLYVAIQQLLTLEKEVIVFAGRADIGLAMFPQVRPTQLHGIEINPYAAELAQVVIWIGYLQWIRDNGFSPPTDPILAPLKTIECRDAILDLTIPTKPQPAYWPEADFIIGNPPFLGSKLFRSYGLPEQYVKAVYQAFDLPRGSDLCCYWFEQARGALQRRSSTRIGLLATQGIRGGENREVLNRIYETSEIFSAWSDRDWILDGAAVHVSIVCFGRQNGEVPRLNGQAVEEIHPALEATPIRSNAAQLSENGAIYMRAPEKGGKFEVEWEVALDWLRRPNPNGRNNLDVLVPWMNGEQLINGRLRTWIIDFEQCEEKADAAQYEKPFEWITSTVAPARSTNRYESLRENWWRFRRPGSELRRFARRAERVLGTTMVAKFRLFRWIPTWIQPDKTIPLFARSDNYFFGVLHSSVHELWARRMGTQLREAESGFRYTPTTCFETFPLPWPPGKERVRSRLHTRISEAARQLDEQRERWLNPPEWVEQMSRIVDRRDTFVDVPEAARPLLRWSAIMAEAAKHPPWKKRTLTKLYNARPTWLRIAHDALDRAVLAAYASVDPAGGWSEDWAEVWVETGAGQTPPSSDPDPAPSKPRPSGRDERSPVAQTPPAQARTPAARRTEVDQRVLANLLRLNLERAGQENAE